MFKPSRLFFFLVASLLFLTAQLSDVKAEGLKAFFSYCTFVSPAQGPYIETYLTFAGATARYRKNADSLYVANIEIDIKISKNDSVVSYREYEIESPPHGSDVSIPPNFLDLQKILLDTGYYILDIRIADKNDTANVSTLKRDLEIKKSDEIYFSDIQLLQDFYPSTSSASHVKNGYAMVPYPLQTAPGQSSFIPENVDSIGFYIELYNTKQVLGDTGRYLITYYLEESFTHGILKENINFIRAKSEEVKIILAKLDFSDVYSGNYNLVLKASDEKNKLITSKTIELQRSKHPVEVDYNNLKDISINNTFVSKIKDKETLIEHLKCLQVIASPNENTFAKNRIKADDLYDMQQFFYYFWEKRNDENPEIAWNKYHKKVKEANELYSSIIYRGYETDRGRIFLKYGPPSVQNKYRMTEHTYPYEIWLYEKTEKLNNRKLVFYNPTIVGNEFPLLHSNMVGETNNSKWVETLVRTKQSKGMNSMDLADIYQKIRRHYNAIY